MTTLTILRGVAGSGKSTYAREQDAVIVSRDSIRHETLGIPSDTYYTVTKEVLADREAMVTRLQNAMITALLRDGRDVIVDNTNTHWKFVTELAKIGYRNGADVVIKTFDVPLETALRQAAGRADAGGRKVDPEIIRKQHQSLQGTKNRELDFPDAPKKYNGTPGKPKAILVDIDGTIAHMDGKRSPYDWKKVGQDRPDLNVIQVIKWIADGQYAELDYSGTDAAVFLFSGRDESSRVETMEWVMKHGVYDSIDGLFMRPEGDMRADNIVKAELFDKHIRDNYDVVMVFDDRNQVVDGWRNMGITCAQVAEGDF